VCVCVCVERERERTRERRDVKSARRPKAGEWQRVASTGLSQRLDYLPKRLRWKALPRLAITCSHGLASRHTHHDVSCQMCAIQGTVTCHEGVLFKGLSPVMRVCYSRHCGVLFKALRCAIQGTARGVLFKALSPIMPHHTSQVLSACVPCTLNFYSFLSVFVCTCVRNRQLVCFVLSICVV